jgi:hypothetical protein
MASFTWKKVKLMGRESTALYSGNNLLGYLHYNGVINGSDNFTIINSASSNPGVDKIFIFTDKDEAKKALIKSVKEWLMQLEPSLISSINDKLS